MIKCKECEKEFKKRRQLHSHLRAHQMKQSDYYYKHEPKFDLYTGDQIDFKDYEDYCGRHFNNKKNFSSFIKEGKAEEVRNVLAEMLNKRAEAKELLWELSEVELVSLQWPSKKQLRKVYDTPQEFFNTLNKRYEETSNVELFEKEMEIVIDTREQKPYKFDGKVKVQGMGVGDYGAVFNDGESNVRIERKGFMDFVASFSSRNVDRLKEEFKRSELQGKQIVVLVEKALSGAMHFDYMPKTAKFVSATPQHILHNVRDMIQEFRNVQFLFVKDRREAKEICRLLLMNDHLCKHDLQDIYNRKLLNVGRNKKV